MKLPRIAPSSSSIVMCSATSGKQRTIPSTKHYRDPSGTPVPHPGTTGWVCIETVGGQTACQWFSRRVFETMNTLSAPGERCRSNLVREFPKMICEYNSIDPSSFTDPADIK